MVGISTSGAVARGRARLRQRIVWSARLKKYDPATPATAPTIAIKIESHWLEYPN